MPGASVSPSYFWGLIQGAAYSGFSASQTVSALTGALSAEGLTMGFGGFSQAMSLFSLAKRQQVAAAALNAATPNQAIDSTMVTTAIDTNLQAIAQQGGGVWRVSWEQVYQQQDGTIVTAWRTDTLANLTTVADLQARLDAIGAAEIASQNASQIFTSPPQAASHVGVGTITAPQLVQSGGSAA